MLRGDIFNQRDIHQFIGCNLIEFNSQFLQEVDRGTVKGSGKKIHSLAFTFLFQIFLPLPGGHGLLIQPVVIVAVPQSSLNHIRLIAAVDGQGVCRIGLDFKTVGTGLCRLFNDPECDSGISAVIGRHFSYDVGFSAVDFII